MTQYWARKNNLHAILMNGRLVDLSRRVRLPFEYEVSFEVARDGRPEVQPLYAYVPSACLMSTPLIAALRAAGVDNLQTFPVVATYADSGAPVEETYEVVNVLGLVSCADLGQSRSTPLADVYYFHELVIDPARTHGLALFRLAESPIEIIVHERIARELERHHFAGLVLTPLRAA